MFRQQLINCETFLYASLSEICLRLTIRQCARCKRSYSERKERTCERSNERRNERDRRILLRHTFRESLCELSRWKIEIYGPALCASGVCTCKRSSWAQVLASTYLRTSASRKHLLKPTSFQIPCVHFHADSMLLVPHWERWSGQTMIRSFGLSDKAASAQVRRGMFSAIMCRVCLINLIFRRQNEF